MDKQVMAANMGVFDKANRLFTGSLLLVAMLAAHSIPAWLFLIPLYPILTAISAWDPFYALYNFAVYTLARRTTTEKLSHTGGKLALG